MKYPYCISGIIFSTSDLFFLYCLIFIPDSSIYKKEVYMKEKYKLKSAIKAAVHGFATGDFSGSDMIEKKNRDVLRGLYRRLQNGDIDYFYISSGGALNGNLYVYTRDTRYSTKNFGIVRVSVFWRQTINGQTSFIPVSHHRFNTLDEYLRYGAPSEWVHVKKCV